MQNIAIIYWSGTGNTEAMAEAVAKGVKQAGAAAELIEASAVDASSLNDYSALAFGCPAMGSEVLEEEVFDPMFTSIESMLQGKKVALFGSYGWGDGTWMEDWQSRCQGDGAVLVADGLTCCEAPDDDALAACCALGEKLAAK